MWPLGGRIKNFIDIGRGGVGRNARASPGREKIENLTLAALLTAITSTMLLLLRSMHSHRTATDGPARTANDRTSTGRHAMVQAEASSQDVAPGYDRLNRGGARSRIRIYATGLVLAALLTGASFAVAGTNLIYGPGIPVALIAFAIAQMGVHLVFFLHITTGPDNTNNVMALAFGILIVLLVIGGTIWIMANLNTNMMLMDPMGVMGQMPM